MTNESEFGQSHRIFDLSEEIKYLKISENFQSLRWEIFRDDPPTSLTFDTNFPGPVVKTITTISQDPLTIIERVPDLSELFWFARVAQTGLPNHPLTQSLVQMVGQELRYWQNLIPKWQRTLARSSL